VGDEGVTGDPPEPGNPLLQAVFLCRLRLTRLLLEGGAYINESDGRGQTALMVACKTRHADRQSASRTRMVQYLLESGADPNIQDKAGRSALMHACLEKAGAGVVSLLLASGADPGLEDHSGSSALVHSVTAGDKAALKVLLDTCKARGKEVIIITTNTLPCGTSRTKQYLNVPPLTPLDQGGGLHLTAAPPCASPSEIQLLTSPQCTSSHPPHQVFNFKEDQCSGCETVSSQPDPQSHAPVLEQSRVERLMQPLQRLNSEPWLRIPASLLALHPDAAPSSSDDLPDISPEEELSLMTSRLGWNNYDNSTPIWYNCSTDLDNNTSNVISFSKSEGRLNEEEVGERDQREEEEGLLVRKLSFAGLSSPHSASNPNLHSYSIGTGQGPPNPSFSTGTRLRGCPLPLPMSSLRSIIQRRHLGADHYNSDPQLAATSRSSTLLTSRESLVAPNLTKRALSGLERQGSGALLLGHISQTRPGCLPPLNSHHHTPIPHIVGVANPSPSGLRPLLPSAPSGLPRDLRTRRMLLRRHSIQTEQIK
uniref:Ankyrin repeat domain 34Ba n=1 Tax=Oncorhynchus tshawytscha TaxID=74940 RepID=A0A8C8DCF9_ONCTS